MIRYATHGIGETLLAGLLRALLQLFVRPALSPRVGFATQRRWLEAMSRLVWLPRGARFAHDTLGDVSGEWVRDASVPSDVPGTLVWLHGGAYCIGSPRTHRALTAHLSRALQMPIFVPHYRLAPEAPFPAALDDALAVVRTLAGHGPVLLGGDSAGGGLALATAVALRDAGDPPPRALLLISPWVDLHVPDDAPPPPRGEALLSAAWARACSKAYRQDVPPGEPRVSPLGADLRRLPPVLIQAGTDEMLCGQAIELERVLQLAGVKVRCEVTERRWHDFQLQAGLLRTADEAIARMATFARAQLPPRHVDGVPFVEVAILGAGMSGLCMAMQLQRAGEHDFLLLEKQPGLGGTWWDNTYPGAHVDVPSAVYSFSFAPNPRWSRRFASAPEIQAYMQGLAERNGLPARIRFDTRITRAQFDETSGLWTLTTQRDERLACRFFVCSTGPLSQPRWPDIVGLDDFAGDKLHSARWNHVVPLARRRVGVIGTGSTAAQLVAPLADRAVRLHVFQRTANWVMPRPDRVYHAADRWLAQFTPYARLVRASWVALLELGRRGFHEGSPMRRLLLASAARHLERQVPDVALRQRLTPDYPLGCKRIIYSSDYYPALGQAHVELVTDAIERIVPAGVITRDGRLRELDVLVCATGFDTSHLLSGVEVQGLQGRRLADAWAAGPHAYHGITVSGFPNLFLMLGPNTATGHTSTLLYIEPAVQHAIACIRAVRAGGHRWVDVRAEVLAAHDATVQQRLAGSVWSQCRSWYRLNGDGRIFALWPGSTREYVQAVRRPRFEDYRFED